MSVQVGKEAPDFTAKAYHEGTAKEIKLSDHRGKWVMLCFYPADFTCVWPTELAAVAVKHSEFQELGVEVLAISVDSNFSHKVWQEVELTKMVDGNIPYPMLSDPGGKIGTQYGVYDEENGVDVRGRFLIDPDGIIQAMEILTPPVGRNVAEVIRQLKAFQHHQKTGELLPSGWQPGKPTLPPETETLKMAGKVWEIWKPELAFWNRRI